MIKMHLKIQDIFTRPNEFLPDMSGGQTDFCEDCWLVYALGTCNGLISCGDEMLIMKL